MAQKKAQPRPIKNAPRSAQATAVSSSQHVIVSPRWLIGAIGLSLAAAVACGWGVLCLMFWQGSWQLLYHPTSAVTRTPASGAGLSFDSIEFAPNAAGIPQLHGWWISDGPAARFTVVYLHGADGNLGNAVDAFIPIRASHVNIFAFDYRGYGTSHFVHPSESRWREDAESVLKYLTETRHIPPGSILLAGKDLGADLALEVAAEHPDLAGVILDHPLPEPTRAIFDDPRARLVPARLLVSDRWYMMDAAAKLHVPSLWFFYEEGTTEDGSADRRLVDAATAPKMDVWLPDHGDHQEDFANALSRWLDGLPAR